MLKRNFVTRFLLKYMQNNEQGVYEKKLADVMRSLDVHNYNFNWDRTGCIVEFYYDETYYRLEHSIDKSKKKGIILRNGLDCLTEVIRSLEDLNSILDRGMNDFETWMMGMKGSPDDRAQGSQEEDYETMEQADYTDYDRKEIIDNIPFETEQLLREYERNRISKRSVANRY